MLFSFLIAVRDSMSTQRLPRYRVALPGDSRRRFAQCTDAGSDIPHSSLDQLGKTLDPARHRGVLVLRVEQDRGHAR